MNRRIFVAFIICLLFSANGGFLHANDRVGDAWKSENFLLPEGKIAYIDPVEGAIYEVNLDGLVTWKYQIPSKIQDKGNICLLYTSPSPRDRTRSRMPSSA